MKEVIIGSRGCGKTNYIKTTLVPNLEKEGKKYLIFDCFEEHDYTPHRVLSPPSISGFNDWFRNIVSNEPLDTTLIVDGAEIFTPEKIYTHSNMLWLREYLRDRQYILCIQSIRRFLDLHIKPDSICFFGTFEDHRQTQNLFDSYINCIRFHSLEELNS